MELDEAFGEDVTEADFLLENLPALHRDRLDVFEKYCETPLRFSIHLTDRGEQFSVELAPDGARARRGEFIDFPLVTLEGESGPWDVVQQHLERAFELGERTVRRHPPSRRIDGELIGELERFDGVFEVELAFPELDAPVEFRVILNDYVAPPDSRQLNVRIDASDVADVLDGRISPETAARSLEISGDMSLAFELSGLLLQHFPELED